MSNFIRRLSRQLVRKIIIKKRQNWPIVPVIRQRLKNLVLLHLTDYSISICKHLGRIENPDINQRNDGLKQRQFQKQRSEGTSQRFLQAYLDYLYCTSTHFKLLIERCRCTEGIQTGVFLRQFSTSASNPFRPYVPRNEADGEFMFRNSCFKTSSSPKFVFPRKQASWITAKQSTIA